MWMLLLACSSTPEEGGDIVAQWEADQAAAIATIAAEPDPIRQLAHVDAISTAHPDQIAPLCAALPKGAAEERCRTFSNRPHLWEIQTAEAEQQEDHTGLTRLPTRLVQVAPAPLASCDGQTEQCRIRAAKQALGAPDGSLEAVAGICNGIPDSRFAGECFFQAAETVLETNFQRLPTSLELCLAADRYASRCVRELGRAMARAAPPADDPSGSWQPILDGIQAGHDWIAQHDAKIARRVQDRLWAEVVWSAYGRAGNITGDLLDLLPEEAHYHVRASAAWWLIDTTQMNAELSVWEESTRAALARRNAPGTPKATAQPTRRQGAEVAITRPWTHFLGDRLRQRSEDADEDLKLVLLETAACRRQWDMVTAVRADPLLGKRARALLESRGPQQ